MNISQYIGNAAKSLYSGSGISDIYGTKTGSDTNTSSGGTIDSLVKRHGNELFGSIIDKIFIGIGNKLDSWLPWLKPFMEPFTEGSQEAENSGRFHKYGDTGQDVPVSNNYGGMELEFA